MFKAAGTPIVFTVCAIAVYFCSNHSIFQLLMQPAVYVLKVATRYRMNKRLSEPFERLFLKIQDLISRHHSHQSTG